LARFYLQETLHSKGIGVRSTEVAAVRSGGTGTAEIGQGAPATFDHFPVDSPGADSFRRRSAAIRRDGGYGRDPRASRR
jgi:hypothetical protein